MPASPKNINSYFLRLKEHIPNGTKVKSIYFEDLKNTKVRCSDFVPLKRIQMGGLIRSSFFKYPSRLPFKFYFCFSWPRQGGIPLPSRGKVRKKRITRSKTTVRSKRVNPLYLDPTVISFNSFYINSC